MFEFYSIVSFRYDLEKIRSDRLDMTDVAKDSLLAQMVRLKLKLNLSDDTSEEIKKEFNNLAEQMSKRSSLSSSSLEDEDYLWLCNNDSQDK